MPRSPLRRKKVFTPPPEKAPVRIGNPRWLVPTMLGMFLLGLLWLLVFYVSQGDYPVKAWENWNIAPGFGFIAAGFMLSTRWR